mmetsp:Transcript_31197/g.81398  ORF Transcript_31197/g.81398 Transcript_31197/m.81398 type:complete len:139 (+) Transcript_31197:817-1233(+)
MHATRTLMPSSFADIALFATGRGFSTTGHILGCAHIRRFGCMLKFHDRKPEQLTCHCCDAQEATAVKIHTLTISIWLSSLPDKLSIVSRYDASYAVSSSPRNEMRHSATLLLFCLPHTSDHVQTSCACAWGEAPNKRS